MATNAAKIVVAIGIAVGIISTGNVLHTIATDVTNTVVEQETVYFDIPLDTDLQDYIFAVSREYSVPAELVLAIIDTESSFDTHVVSESGCYGLMQLNAEYVTGIDLLDPYQNIRYGVSLFREYADMYDGDFACGLMAYNGGPWYADNLMAHGKYTTPYVEKVFEQWRYYESVRGYHE